MRPLALVPDETDQVRRLAEFKRSRPDIAVLLTGPRPRARHVITGAEISHCTLKGLLDLAEDRWTAVA
jgi:hypothetical protein